MGATITVNRAAWDFYLFEYFGIVSKNLNLGEYSVAEDTKETRALKCAYRAYLDMNRTLTYQHDKNDKQKQHFVTSICKELADLFVRDEGSIEEKRKEAEQVFFEDDDCEKPKSKLVKMLTTRDSNKRNEKVFYYGQAQKWINMTLKYMWLIGLLKLAEIDELEVPIDNYILKGAACDKGVDMPKHDDNSNIAWSQLYKTEYINYQKELENRVEKPAEWECNAWIAQATLERIKEEKKKYKSEKEYAQSNRLYSQNMKSSDKN